MKTLALSSSTPEGFCSGANKRVQFTIRNQNTSAGTPFGMPSSQRLPHQLAGPSVHVHVNDVRYYCIAPPAPFVQSSCENTAKQPTHAHTATLYARTRVQRCTYVRTRVQLCTYVREYRSSRACNLLVMGISKLA